MSDELWKDDWAFNVIGGGELHRLPDPDPLFEVKVGDRLRRIEEKLDGILAMLRHGDQDDRE